MFPFLDVVLAIAGMFSSLALLALCVLVLRNPAIPDWMQSDGTAQAVGIVMTVVIAAATAMALNNLVAAGLHAAVAAGVVIAVVIGSAALLYLTLGMRKRLRRYNDAEASSQQGQPSPRRTRRLRPATGADPLPTTRGATVSGKFRKAS